MGFVPSAMKRPLSPRSSEKLTGRLRKLLVRKNLPALRLLAHRRLLEIAVSMALLASAAPLCRGSLPDRPLTGGVGPPFQKEVLEPSRGVSGSYGCSFRLVLANSLPFPETADLRETHDWNEFLGGAAILLFLSFLWAEVLRRRVRGQTTLLQEWARREVALKNKYEELFENANDAIFSTDLKGKLTSINRATEKLTGASREEALGADVSDYVAEEYRERTLQFFSQIPQDGASTTHYLEIVAKSGRRVPLEISSRLIYEDGKAAGLQGIARDITERKALEEKLALREKRLASFFAAAPAGLAILDSQLRFLQINETLAHLIGLSPQEIIGKSLREAVPKFAPVIEPAMQQVLRDGKPLVNFSHKGETPTQPGVLRHMISSYFPIPALEGEATDLAVIAVDVTHRKRAEEALRMSEERLNSILGSLQDVVWSVAPEDHRVLYLNPATETVYGRKVSEFYQDPGLWLKITHPDDRKQITDSFARLFEKGSVDQEFRILRPDGAIHWLHDRSRAIRDAEGAVIRLDGISTDITERKQTEEGLKLYREVFARSNEAGAIFDREYHFLEQNAAHRDLLGFSDDELRQAGPAAMTGEKTLSELHEQGRQASSFRAEAVFQTRSGKSLNVELSAFSILSDTGDVLCHAGLVRDITAQKRTELERQNAHEAAEAANRAKSEFLANMSHEIRTPLNGVLGMTELALNTKLSEEQREYLTLVKTSGETLLTVINDILDFSKIEAGRLDINPIDFELRDSLGDTLKALSLRAHQKGLELALHVAHDVPYRVEGDPTRLRQIVINLVSNAIKFTDHGEVVLHARMESQTEEEIFLHFTVTDTGVGIPSEKQQMIFAPFTQADSSATRRYGGTGLGLAISVQLVELMGGRLWVESEEGKGSSFHFVVCLRPAKSKSDALPSSETVNLRGLATLVVDDNATNRRLLEEILVNWGMRPAMADGGWTGLAAMEQAKSAGKPFPLVLIDASMPDMDGFTLAERIKEDPALSRATIMMLTSGGRRGDAARCRKLGIAAYLHKPVKERDLFQAILLALSPRRSHAEDAELITRHTLREEQRNLRVLLAEDDLVSRQFAKHLLRKAGYQVTAVQNGREAVAAIQSSGPDGFDVVLMDIQMPEMDGLEATAAIRALEQGTSTRLPIIAMTAHAMKGDRARFLKAGMDGYVAKPVQARQLISAIEETLPAAGEAHPESGVKMPERPVINWKRGLATVEGDSQLFHDLLKLFADGAPAALGKLRAAVEIKDSAAIERIAHTLKGSVSNFGAEEAVQAALRLETMARNGDLEHAEEAFRRIETEIGRVMAAMETPENEVAGWKF